MTTLNILFYYVSTCLIVIAIFVMNLIKNNNMFIYVYKKIIKYKTDREIKLKE